MSFDVERARRDTPGCETVLHFNNAGSALPPRQVLDAQVKHLRLEATIGGYEAADRASEAVERVYDAAAGLIGARRDEIAIVENATRAWDMAFYAVPLGPGDRVLTAVAEYASNYIAMLQVAARTGAVIEAIPNDELGQVSVEALTHMLDDRVKLIAVTHVPTNGGLVNPVAEIGAVARDAGALFLVDACQSVGQLPVNVNDFDCDMLSTTGRKYLRGPRGVGFLYVRAAALDRLEPPFLDLHAARWISRDRFAMRDDARRFENWETNYAAKIGLGVAIECCAGWGIDAIWARVRSLADQLRDALSGIPGVTVHDLGAVRCGIVTFTIDGLAPEQIKTALSRRAMNVTTSTPFSTRLDMEARGLSGLVRASVHYYNTDDEIERFCAAIEAIA